MAIARRAGATGSISWSGQNAFTIPKPPNVVAGDVLILVITTDSSMGTVVAPSGWSQTNLGNFSRTSIATQLWCKVLGGSEPANYTFAWSAQQNGTAIIAGYSGVDNLQPIDVATVTGNGTTASDTIPSQTFVTSGAWQLYSMANVGTATWTPPGAAPTISLVLDSGHGVALFDSGPYTTPPMASRTFTQSVAQAWLGEGIALRPAAAGGGVHSGLSGSGSFSVSSPGAVKVALTIPAGYPSVASGNPTRYYKLGGIAFSNANGTIREYYVQHATELVVAPISDSTTLFFHFATGISGTITELLTP